MRGYLLLVLLCVSSVSALTVIPSGGEFDNPVYVVLASNDIVTYTLDGSKPSLDSQLYSGPFLLEDSSLLRVTEFARDGLVLDERSLSFAFVDDSCILKSISASQRDQLDVVVEGVRCTESTVGIHIGSKKYYVKFDGTSAQLSIPYRHLSNGMFDIYGYIPGSRVVHTSTVITQAPSLSLYSLSRPLRAYEAFTLPPQGIIEAKSNYPVSFFINGVRIGYDSTPPYTFEYALGPGRYTFTASAGGVSASSQVTIGRLPPTISLTQQNNRYIAQTAASSVVFTENGFVISRDSTPPFELFYDGDGYIQALAD